MSGKKKSGSARAVPRSYGRLTRHERDTVQRMLERGASCRQIARELGRSPSTVSSEVASHRFVTAPKARRGERVDASADLDMAARILVNAKCQRPSVCNAAESLLVHKDVAEQFLPMAAEGLAPDHVAIHGCPRTMDILGDSIAPATDEDYGREYLGYEISCKVVDSLDEAIEHINRFNTGHSECIVTRDYDASQRFLEEVDAAAVYVNASTRFTDGFEFGFGAEIGISTQKLHARGPMGLTALTTTKYIIYGNGQVR